MKKVLMFICVMGFILFVSQANALTLDSVSGTWSNVVGDPSPVFQTMGDENQVRWGTNAGYGLSGLGFTGSAPPSFNLALETEFDLGTLRHFNNPVYSPLASSVDLSLSLGFSDPTLNTSSLFNFAIDETPNWLACAYPGSTNCPDKISFPSVFSEKTFIIDDILYTLELVGFRDLNGSPVSDFISEEGGINSAILVGKITSDIAPVPEPGTMLLLGIGLLGAGAFRKKLKR